MAESAPSTQVAVTSTLPAGTIGTVSESSGDIDVPWTKADDSTDGDWDVERSTDGGSSWNTITSGLSPSTTSYTDTTAQRGTTYVYRVERNTNHAEATSGESNSIRMAKRLTRTATVSGNGNSTVARSLSKTRTATVDGATSATTATRAVTRPRHATVAGSGAANATRQPMSKSRATALTGDAAMTSMQTFRPVFPDERALDVQWDFTVEHMGFASEWLDETSIISREIRDGIGVVIGGHLSTTIEVFVEYDESGDGTPDVTSEIQELSNGYHTLAFDDEELFGEDGWYRVVVRGLRTYDTVNQLDIGAIHANL